MKKAQDFSYKTLLTIFLFLLAVVLFLAFSKSRRATAAWWDETWMYRKAISLANNSGSNLTDFQVSTNE